MAGERIGKTYEALLKVVLDNLKKRDAFIGNVYWNQTPNGIIVEPDFTIGNDKDHPTIVFLVTHSTTPNNSQMKCWRNLGELSDLKTTISPAPKVINVIFDSIIKTDLKALQDAAFDSQVIVGDTEYGRFLANWVLLNDKNLPTDQYEKALFIAQESNQEMKTNLKLFEEAILSALGEKKPALDQLWADEARREKKIAPAARNTFLRLGYMKRLLAGEAITGKGVRKDDISWLSGLGIVSPSISGVKIADTDLLWFMNTKYALNYDTIALPCLSDGFCQQLKKIRSYSLMRLYGEYVANNLAELSTPEGMQKCLEQQYIDPTEGITIPNMVDPPDTVWIFDFITSLSRAQGNRFGYPEFSRHPLANSEKIGNMSVGVWCSCFLTQYCTRKSDFNTPPAAIQYSAVVLSEQLKGQTKESIERIIDKIVAEYLHKEYQTSMPSHRGFEPLLALLISEGVVEDTSAKQNIQACFAENAGLSGQAGRTPVVQVKNTLIKWQTATDAGRDHKRNELCGRAVGLRYSWNKESRQFEPRDGVKKLILLLDGTWRQKDLDALIKAGWDEIYYPDEIDKLKAAIV